MPLIVNLCHLEAHNINLKGVLPLDELDLDSRDQMVRAEGPLGFELEVQKLDEALLLQGRLSLPLRCACVRCLKAFDLRVVLDAWTRLLPLEGEEKVAVLNDCVDLTPYLREDILLEFPQHPLCGADCSGAPMTENGRAKKCNAGESEHVSSAWAELDKLKF